MLCLDLCKIHTGGKGLVSFNNVVPYGTPTYNYEEYLPVATPGSHSTVHDSLHDMYERSSLINHMAWYGNGMQLSTTLSQ